MVWVHEPGRRVGFAYRREASAVLADRLKEFANRKDIAVLALPRGGVPVGYAVARALEASQTTDDEVRQLLSRANARATPGITRSA